MQRTVFVGLVLSAVVPCTLHGARSCAEEPWRQLYQGEQATGRSVVALWQFLPGQQAQDNSGHGHVLQLRGQSRFVSEGMFGNCLECFPADKDHDVAQGALVKNHADLSPKGAFTLEMWIRPKPELAGRRTAFLLDKKYYHYAKDLPQANCDYCLYLSGNRKGTWRIVAYLGYGNDSVAYTSGEITLEPNRWTHVAFTYDGAGIGRFFLDGKPVGRVVHEGRGPITPGRYDLAIGDRYGSIHAGFPGYIDQVRISSVVVPYFTAGLQVGPAPASRTAFVRMEPGAELRLVVLNDTAETLKQVKASVSLSGASKQYALEDLAPGVSKTISIPVDTRLRPDRYPLEVALAAQGADRRWETRNTFEVTIVPRPLPSTMPVVMWGTGDLDRLQQIGFTHQLVHLADYARIWRAGRPTEAFDSGIVAERAAMLDEYLARGVGAVATLSPARWLMQNEQTRQRFQRVNRAGQPYKEANTCGLFPEVQQYCYNVGASVAGTFGHFPALQAALVHTEIRDHTNLCFHQLDRQAFRQLAGFDIPEAATGKRGVQYEKIEGFPSNRIVPDDYPLLVFYRWFWKEGDGWNALHTAVHRGLKSTGRGDLWTFFDPAVRVPSVWGSGGQLDVISQWTYSYPDPIKIGQAADELFAMAEGRSGKQQVMKMTQIIWYRSQTAPKLPEDESQRAQWEKDIPDARFITIAPDHLREAFWSKISRPVRGIMYHGWGSLVEAEHGAYRYTNPKTKEVLGELIRKVVRPLGPTLLQVPDAPCDVALLESFTSQMFARRGTYGWGHSWEADMHLVLQWAQLPPRIVYEETILRDRLDGYRILVLPACDVLPAAVAEQIARFQAAGGLVVADELLTPAVKPDVVVPSYKRTGKAREDKAALQALAARLRQQLEGRYGRRADSSNPDVVVRLRQFGPTPYLFAVNDHRTFGNYVGHHGRVMEKGLPSSATLSLRGKGRFVYDLVAGRQLSAERAGQSVRWNVRLGPGDGRVFMITHQPIDRVLLNVPAEARRGESALVAITVVDPSGEPLPAVVPLEVTILDSENRPAEPSGYYGASGGKLTVSLDVAPNDAAGRWTIAVRELASGKTARGELVVRQ